MEKSISSRNNALDLLKLFSAFMVVFIHVPFYGEFGMAVEAIARFAVPIFFMTSGFFCYKNDTAKIRKKILKIAGILFTASVLYNATNIAFVFLKDGAEGIKEYLSVFLEPLRWLELIVFNRPFSATRLWFLVALIYVYVMQIVLQKIRAGEKTVLFFAVGGLLINVLLSEGLALFGTVIEEIFVRNFLLTGYPFFGIGLLLRLHKEKVINVKTSMCIALISVGVVLTLISNLFVESAYLYIGSIMIAVASFILAMKSAEVRYPAFLITLSECSLGIYILHRPVATVIGKCIEILGVTEGSVAEGVILPISVCIATSLLTLVLIIVKKKLLKKKSSFK